MGKIADIQTILSVPADGDWGPVSQGALDALIANGNGGSEPHVVFASSFADPEDVKRFWECKKLGGSDEQCFKEGDNGIGEWGDNCAGDNPICALPPEDWEPLGDAARGKRVKVTANGKTVICELRDTMPHKEHITNGCGIDLNPGAVKALGLTPPIRVRAIWQWA